MKDLKMSSVSISLKEITRENVNTKLQVQWLPEEHRCKQYFISQYVLFFLLIRKPSCFVQASDVGCPVYVFLLLVDG